MSRLDDSIRGYGPFTQQYGYNVLGAVSSISYPRAMGGTARTIDLGYRRGYPVSVLETGRTYCEGATCHRNGMLESLSVNNAAQSTLVDADGRNRIQRIGHEGQNLIPFFDTGTFTYSDAGNIVAFVIQQTPPVSDTFGYDALSRITSCSIHPRDPNPGIPGPYAGSYTYDVFGNMTCSATCCR